MCTRADMYLTVYEKIEKEIIELSSSIFFVDELDEFNTFSIYQVLPQLIQLWGLNIQTEVDTKKSSSNRP